MTQWGSTPSLRMIQHPEESLRGLPNRLSPLFYKGDPQVAPRLTNVLHPASRTSTTPQITHTESSISPPPQDPYLSDLVCSYSPNLAHHHPLNLPHPGFPIPTTSSFTAAKPSLFPPPHPAHHHPLPTSPSLHYTSTTHPPRTGSLWFSTTHHPCTPSLYILHESLNRPFESSRQHSPHLTPNRITINSTSATYTTNPSQPFRLLPHALLT